MATSKAARDPIVQKAPMKVTQRAYALAAELHDVGAGSADIAVTTAMRGPALLELVTKGVAKRSGAARGRYGALGTIRLMVAPEQLITVANRASRRHVVVAQATQRESARLTIADLEAFVQSFHELRAPLLDERSRAINARITELQRHLAVAVGDDFRNTMAMANAALRELDDVEHAADAEVIEQLEPDAGSALYPVWAALRGGPVFSE